MILYRAQLRLAAERDTANHPEIARAFQEAGYDNRSVQNRVHYVCNAGIERLESDEAITKRAAIAETVSFESDGHPCLVKDMADAERVLQLMNHNVEERKTFVIKPYRSAQQLVDYLIKANPEIPREMFETVDPEWQEKAAKLLQFKRRMGNKENPVTLSKDLVLLDVDGGGASHYLNNDIPSITIAAYLSFATL